MRNKITFLQICFLFIFPYNPLFAQPEQDAVSKIRHYLNYIDSLADNDNMQKKVIQGIEEGVITLESVSKSSKKNNQKKIKALQGGWGQYTLANSKGDTVYRVKYHDNLIKNLYLNFYYQNNQPVYAKIEYQQNGIGQTFYFKEEFYENGMVLFSNESKNKIDEIYQQRVNFNLIKKAIDLLQEKLNKNNNP
jgi:hypothetical protein